MQDRFRVVFVSSRNSLRSILAEACLAHLAKDRFIAASCGQPGRIAAAVHPAAIGALASAGMATPIDAPKSWDRWLRGAVPVAHFVITLDEEVTSVAPRWPGQPELATWSFPDIAAQAGSDPEAAALASIKMLYSLRRRLELFCSLPLRGSDRSAIRSDVRDLAHLQ